ncbi:MAG: cysteine--tRNA ligase [Rickettsiales bacterium]|jgi:cysteinyl-tRNA synthetase|nr:cysteine--tRNA ligase [Rickettsiales bacterium]
MTIRLYNTLSLGVEEFKPVTPGEARFYSCGPTVYHFAHIGNMRAYVMADVLKRMLIANGLFVRHIINITDVGHLTSDADTGEDKMEKGSRRTGESVRDVAKFYTEAFMRDMDDLNNLPPAEYTKATDFIKEQIALVEKLEALGYTYKIEGDGIYYDTSKFPSYGELGHQPLDELKAGARIALADGKRNPTDFALWKFSPKDEKRQMEWDSPWGVGFPGWHIECSAMSLAKLGDRLDIHSGGVDHIKIHHTNEIAQSEPVVGHKWVNHWMHVEHLNDKTGKMSKSVGDFLTITALKERGIRPIEYRYYLLLASYRTMLEFTFEGLEAAAKAYRNLVARAARLIENPDLPDSSRPDAAEAEAWKRRMLDAASNDLNTAGVIAALQDALKDGNMSDKTKAEIAKYADGLLGLTIMADARALEGGREVRPEGRLLKLIKERQDAKAAKDWAKADAIRAEIDAMGYALTDEKDGVKATRK